MSGRRPPAPKAAARAPAPAKEEAAPKANGVVAKKEKAAPKVKEPQDTEADVKKRQQMTQILGIDVSNARCEHHMRMHLVSPDVEDELMEKRKELKELKETIKTEGGDPSADDGVKTLKAEIKHINENKVRVKGDAPIAMAAIADRVVKSLIIHAMEQTLASDRKMVEIGALHSGELHAVDVYPLVCRLPAIADYDPAHEEELKKERAEQNKKAKEAREEAKKQKDAEGAEKPKKAAPVVKDESDDDKEEKHGSKITFVTYISNATDTVKKIERYSGLRVANRLREVVSDVTTELVGNFATMSKHLVPLVGVRTLNADHLKTLVKLIFIQYLGTEEDEGLTSLLEYVDEKLKLYHGHVEEEKQRKADNMSDEKKAELEAKKKKLDLERKQSKIANNTKKARELAQQAKLLKAELEGSA